MSDVYPHMSEEQLIEQINGVQAALDSTAQADQAVTLSHQLILLREALAKKRNS